MSTVMTALALGLTVDTVLVLVSKFIYIYGLNNKAVIVLIAAITLGIVIGVILRPSTLKCATIADKLGGEERFITALEIIKNNKTSSMANDVVEDAKKFAATTNLKGAYSAKPNKLLQVALLVAALAFLCALILPIPPSEKLETQQEMHQKYDDAIEEMQNEIKSTNLTDKQKAKVNRELLKLKKELSKIESKTEAVNSLMQSQTRLKQIADESENAAIKDIGERLSENNSTQHLGEALKNGNIEDFSEQLSALTENLDKMTDKELKALGKAFKKAAESNNIDKETVELLNELGDTLQNNLTDEQLASVTQNLNEFSDKVNELAKENQDIREAIEKINKDISKLDDSGKANKANGNTSGDGSTVGGNGENDNNGAGDGENGSGEDSNSQGNNNSSGDGRGKGSIENANIYISDAKDMNHYSAEIDSNGSENGKPNGEKVVEGADGKVIPYTQVFENYKNEAIDSIDKENIPYGVKDIVRDYFSSLE